MGMRGMLGKGIVVAFWPLGDVAGRRVMSLCLDGASVKPCVAASGVGYAGPLCGVLVSIVIQHPASDALAIRGTCL